MMIANVGFPLNNHVDSWRDTHLPTGPTRDVCLRMTILAQLIDVLIDYERM